MVTDVPTEASVTATDWTIPAAVVLKQGEAESGTPGYNKSEL